MPMLERKRVKMKQRQTYGKSAAASGSSHCGGAGKQQEKVPPAQVAGALLKITIAKVIGPV